MRTRVEHYNYAPNSLIRLVGFSMAVVIDEKTVRFSDEVAEKLRLRPGERLVVRIKEGAVILTKSKAGSYSYLPRELLEEALREVEEGEYLP